MTNLKNSVMLVTGANAGIGKATCLGLAKLGATVVMVARDAVRGEIARQEIIRQSGNQGVDLLLADLSSQRSIRELARQFSDKYPALQVLINNAGGQFGEYRKTVDGLEWTFAVDHLAGFLLTHLLLDKLKAGAPSRIITVSSQAQTMGHIDFEDLQSEKKKYGGMRAYSQAKLANILFTYELARRLHGTGLTANCLHPGVVNTNFLSNTAWWFKILAAPMVPFMLSPEQGAETSLYLATAPELATASGGYYAKKKIIPSIPESRDPEVAKRLWDVSLKLTNLKPVL